MGTTTISVIAATATIALIALWFWMGRKELKEKQILLDAAKNLLRASREECKRVRDGPENAVQRKS